MRRPRVGRRVAGGRWEEPSVHANQWEVLPFFVMLDVFPDMVRDNDAVVRSDSVPACKCVRNLSASLDSGAAGHLVGFPSRAISLNCRECPEHIFGELKVLADTRSRGQWRAVGQHTSSWMAERGAEALMFLLGLYVKGLHCPPCHLISWYYIPRCACLTAGPVVRTAMNLSAS